MILDRVTVTGADDAVNPKELAALARDYPWLELGVLFSASRQGKKPRYPSREWMEDLIGADWHPSLSAHMCGAHVRAACDGDAMGLPLFMLAYFQRVQINLKSNGQRVNFRQFFPALRIIGAGQFIFQVSKPDDLDLMHLARGRNIDAVPLFDASGGAGIVPGQWPAAVPPYTGYAGGLTPDNLDAQLARIAEAAGDCRVWIDTESGARTDDRFDLAKVRRFLDVAGKWVTQ